MKDKKTPFFVRFRAYVGKENYFKVFIFRDMKTMHAFYLQQQEALGNPDRSTNFYGMCRSYFVKMKDKKTGRYRKAPEIGCFLLSQENMQPRVVAHEAAHAASFYMEEDGRRLRRLIRSFERERSNSYCDRAQEELAYAVGDLTADIYNGLRRNEAYLRKIAEEQAGDITKLGHDLF